MLLKMAEKMYITEKYLQQLFQDVRDGFYFVKNLDYLKG